jgi:ABC-2 type transport system permease protein
MFLKIFRFEINYRFRRPATYAYFGILFLFALITGIYGNGPASEKAFVNASYTIGQLLIVISIFSMLIASAVMGVPIYRDIEYGTKDYFFAYPIKEKSYLMGRYFGSFAVLIFISLGLPIGYLIGLPIGAGIGEFEPERLGPFVLMHYLYPTLVFTLPNLFFTGTLFFAAVGLTRNVRITYVGSVLLFIGYLLANTLTQDLEKQDLVDILDPFALTTYFNATKYWTPVEQNTLVPSLSGNLLYNRLLWVGVSMIVFAFTYFKFSFRNMLEITSEKIKKAEVTPKTLDLRPLPFVNKIFSTGSYFSQMLRQSLLEFNNIVKDIYFIAILLAGVIFLFLDGWFGNPIYGTPSLPVTYYMLEVKDFNYGLFVFIIIIFYTGEVVHRDRSVNYSNIADALPVPNWMTYGSKFLSLLMVCIVLVNMILVCGVLNQTLQGYFNYEWGMYFTDLYLLEFPEYIQLTMLAFIIHILVNNKFLGHIVSIGVWILMFSLRSFAELNYNLFFYSYAPGYTISDMNGFGHFINSISWFHVYWTSLGIIFLLIGNLFWNRGSETAASVRLKIAKSRINKSLILGFVLFGAIFISSGSYIYYNISKLNTYRTNKEGLQRGADFELKYSKYEFSAQPKITDAKVYIDLFPSSRSVEAKGDFVMVNKTDQPIDSLLLFIQSQVANTKIKELKVNNQIVSLVVNDTIHNHYAYLLPNTFKPGDTATLSIQMTGGYRGFDNSGTAGSIVHNGSFINLGIFPTFGYPGDVLNSDKDRKKYKLPEKKYTLPPQDDKHGLRNFLFTDDGDWITYEAIVSTEPDQIAVSPGYLQKEWEENGRRYFHYKMDGEIDLFANFSSARYAVHRDEWQGENGETVNIEIFHHPTHTYNLDRFTKSVKASLSYYTKNFSPYQFRQMRILEFPRYASFAQSFPNTVPYSESFGWVGDFSDPEDTDYAFYVTAHEVAHQWWGHQVMPSATRGANQISESMAEYAALMVLKHEYGDECMQRFLKYSLDRYLRGRASESKFEATLLENDSRSYVWYQKGSLVLYALQDLIGEEKLNQAFKKFVDSSAFRAHAPFVTSNEWYSYIKEATPDSLNYFIEDSFEKIALYENKILKSQYEKISDSQYKVTLEVQSRKVYYDEKGNETGEGQQSNYIDIGIFAEDGKNDRGMTIKSPLYLKKHWIKPGTTTIEFVVDKQPIKAGIDPYNKLIDRIPDDNVKSVETL